MVQKGVGGSSRPSPRRVASRPLSLSPPRPFAQIMASEKQLGLARGGDKGEPLLPAPTPSQHSTPARPTSARLIKISLALLALASLYWQYGPAITLPQLHPRPPAHSHSHAYSGEAAYARRLAGLNNLDQSLFSSSPPQRHKHQQQRPLSYAELKETLLSVPTPESAKAASKS